MKQQCYVEVSQLALFLALFLLLVLNTKMFNDPSHFSKSESCIMQVQRSKSNFLHGGVCSPLDGVIGRRETSKELGERSDKLQRGAPMPGQRRAGQLVYYKHPVQISNEPGLLKKKNYVNKRTCSTHERER